MKRRYKKQVRVAMIVALTATVIAYSTGNLFAQSKDMISENTLIDTIEENTEIEVLRNKENVQNVEKVIGDIAIDETNFPDPVFRERIRTGSSFVNGTYIPYDSNSDGVLSSDEINNITSITVPSYVASLQGIEHFSNLKELVCSFTNVTTLDISKNTALERLLCQSTKFTSLDVSKNTALTYLQFEGTGITELDISKNTALRELVCIKTGITRLDVSNNPALEILNCYLNEGITELDVSNNPALRDLTCWNTGITSLDVSNNPALEYLNFSHTGITELDVSKNPALTALYCNDTGITSLDVSNNPALDYLECSNTGIKELDVSNNLVLRALMCSNTGITELDVSKNTALVHFKCNGTGITSLDVSRSPLLYDLWCDSTEIKGLDLSNNLGLTMYSFPWDKLAWINLGNNPRLRQVEHDFYNTVDLGEIVGGAFNITGVLPGIDPNKIMTINGAILDKNTGVVSGYTNGIPITYTYDCNGLSYDGDPITLNITLNFTKVQGPSTITINDSLDKVYDGQAVAEPQVTVTGSTGAITFQWYTVDGVKLGSAPSEVGSYKLVVTVIEDANYSGVTTEVVFMIKEAQPNHSSESNNKEEWNESIGNQVSGIQTGDITKVGLWILLVGLSIGLMLFFIKKSRKED